GGDLRMTPLVAVAVTVLLPLLVAPVTTLPGRSGEVARRIAAWAAVPALVVALIPADLPTSPLPWLLLGARFGLDPIGRTFLLLFGLLWTVSGLYARGYVPE